MEISDTSIKLKRRRNNRVRKIDKQSNKKHIKCKKNNTHIKHEGNTENKDGKINNISIKN